MVFEVLLKLWMLIFINFISKGDGGGGGGGVVVLMVEREVLKMFCTCLYYEILLNLIQFCLLQGFLHFLHFIANKRKIPVPVVKYLVAL